MSGIVGGMSGAIVIVAMVSVLLTVCILRKRSQEKSPPKTPASPHLPAPNFFPSTRNVAYLHALEATDQGMISNMAYDRRQVGNLPSDGEDYEVPAIL